MSLPLKWSCCKAFTVASVVRKFPISMHFQVEQALVVVPNLYPGSDEPITKPSTLHVFMINPHITLDNEREHNQRNGHFTSWKYHVIGCWSRPWGFPILQCTVCKSKVRLSLKYSMIYMIVLFGLLHSLFYPFLLICLFPDLFIKIPNKPTVIHKLHQKDSPGDWKILVFTVTNRALRPWCSGKSHNIFSY